MAPQSKTSVRINCMAFALKDYEIIDEIGRGGFGSVLRARQKSLGRIVAIKCLIPQRSQNKHDIIRFRREAEAMAALTNENIISVYDYAYFGGNYYIVMEYIEGISFDTALQRGIPVMESLIAMERVAAALKSAHAENVVHRDVKPANILLGKKGRIKLADFGLATFQQELTQQSSMVAVIGTLSYMAPESMVNPADVDRRVDIYSLGCMLYEILTGKVPFPGNSLGEVSYKVLNEPVPEIAADSCPEALRKTTIECLHKDREDRPDMQKVHSVLAEHVSGRQAYAREDIASFVAGKEIARRQPPGPEIPGVSSGGHSRKVVVLRALTALFGIASIALIVSAFLQRNDRKTSLPTIGMLSDSLETEQPYQRGKGSDSGPGPLISSTPGSNVGTLMIKGIKRTDTLVINGKRARSFSSEGLIGVPLAPGPNKIEIRAADGSVLRRQVEVMPLQIISWDIKAERSAHDRK
ncbi:MAG: protein kinase [Chitinivibrionales bacterium]|nr:protein kinase [Chitinivibrionales bacterium]